MPKQYDEDANFNNRFKVETNYGGEIIDHHKEFAKREYAQAQNKVYQPPEGSSLPTVKRGQRTKVEAPKPQPRQKPTDEAIEAANKKDLRNRNLK